MAQAKFTDAIALLKADHRNVEALFEKFESAREDRKQALAQQICNELKIHTIIEEETYTEAFVEHDAAKILINDIMASSPDDEFFDAKVKVLSEEIKHHVHEEEARSEGMFSQARETGMDMVALRDAMLARKHELLAQAKAEALPQAELRVVQARP